MTIAVDADTTIRWHFKSAPSDKAVAWLAWAKILIARDLAIVKIAGAMWKSVRFEGASADIARPL